MRIKDISLAKEGMRKIEWVKSSMPVLSLIDKRFTEEKPLKGYKVAVCVHLEAKTAYLCMVLRNAGAQVSACGCNPLSTKDEICAALAEDGIDVNGWFGATGDDYLENIRKTLEFCPDVIIDDGGDFVEMLHGSHPEYASNIIGGCEETTTGIHRLKARAGAGLLKFPMMDVNDADSKHLFDNRHGTGQSVWDAIMFTTNNIIAGKTVVVGGYGFCGSGIAKRAKGLGARVIVTEINPIRALEAAMEGYEVMKMDDAAALGDIFVTSTGCKDVIVKRHFEKMKDNVIVANAGHFDVEFSKNDLEKMAVRKEERKNFITGYYLSDGRVINAMADGRLVNIVAGNGHPAEIMDMSFSLQALSVEYLVRNGKQLENKLYNVPEEIDRNVAVLKAEAMGLGIDCLTKEQEEYISSMN
ncbi:MAG: adenosylhomocysteinase [Clostridia bacterium]|nr:adenosylhomocysteinase [Clostridia bacterium]